MYSLLPYVHLSPIHKVFLQQAKTVLSAWNVSPLDPPRLIKQVDLEVLDIYQQGLVSLFLKHAHPFAIMLNM